MRFHVVGLPHTFTTDLHSSCAYTQKARGFCKMMTDLGHEVYLYSTQFNDAPCLEHISCMNDEEVMGVLANVPHYTKASFNTSDEHWVKFNARAAREIGPRLLPKDFICLTAGLAHKPICDLLQPDFRVLGPNQIAMAVEYAVGYGGSFTDHKVFESYAWMHACYAARSSGNVHAADGSWYDAVVPGYLDVSKFPFHKRKKSYLLYVGRLESRKGVQIAVEVAKATDKRLIIAGPGEFKTDYENVQIVGEVDAKTRNELMVDAHALIAPTLYIEPFGNVVIEAQACGTPVITTDWGAFTETVVHGVTGYRCRTLREFAEAVHAVPGLDNKAIRGHVKRTYDLSVIGPRYEAYFQRLSDLWKNGWYQLEKE